MRQLLGLVQLSAPCYSSSIPLCPQPIMSNTNKEKNSTCWHAVDDAALVHMLTDQKIKGNWGDNNPKKVAWSACETALAGSEKNSGGTPKTVTAIKN